ncbi:hypothetical protein [Sorangium sp. So ce1024]|uniref:hypothetical protein n=1 Tax=unclassified Sorangium TaxID=2621164 RepID=UPI003EFDD3F7
MKGARHDDIAPILVRAGPAEPHVFVDGDDAVGGAGAVRLMVRGRFPEGPLMLPRPFRC